MAATFLFLSFRAVTLRNESLRGKDLGIDFNYPRHFVTSEMEVETRSMKNLRPSEVKAVDEMGRPVDIAPTKGSEPQFLLFIKDGCHCSIDAQPLFNRLGRRYKDSVEFLGVIDGDRSNAQTYAERYTCAFPVVADRQLAVVRDFNAKGGVYSALVARNGHIVKMWPGYNADILKEMNRLLAEEAGVKETPFDPQYAPTRKTAGCAYTAEWAK
jgi:peroxiredoxin